MSFETSFRHDCSTLQMRTSQRARKRLTMSRLLLLLIYFSNRIHLFRYSFRLTLARSGTTLRLY